MIKLKNILLEIKIISDKYFIDEIDRYISLKYLNGNLNNRKEGKRLGKIKIDYDFKINDNLISLEYYPKTKVINLHGTMSYFYDIIKDLKLKFKIKNFQV